MDNSLDIITVFNPDPEPFEVVYDNKSYGFIMPGMAKRMPRFLARLAVKHLIDRILTRLKIQTNNIDERTKWSQKVVIEEEISATASAQSPAEKLQREMDELNKSDLDRVLSKQNVPAAAASDNFVPAGMSAPVTPTPVAPVVPAPVAPVMPTPSVPVAESLPVPPSPAIASLGIAAPAGDAQVMPEVDNTDAPAAEVPAVPVTPAPGVDPALVAAVQPAPGVLPAQPTREQLYEYATNTLAMDLNDAKTKAALDAQSPEELMQTLSYEPGA
jgi:hypothetical protein